jgi:tetratricopeptide (TPR) repeat protein
MALTLLTCIFLAGGVLAVLYSSMALLSWLNHTRVRKARADIFKLPAAGGINIAGVFWRRANILLRYERFDAAIADCKRILEIFPNHAEARNLLEHLVSPDTFPGIPERKESPPSPEAEKAESAYGKAAYESEREQGAAAAVVGSVRQNAAEGVTFETKPGDMEDSVAQQDKKTSKLLLLLRLKYLKK